ncbi:pilus assembly protein TadG-related protein [Aurantiacibacter sp. MUD11]|nr:TadE/TadG family type IV pilus assembly protein [Aurantiacibacter sp. MUD11]WAT19388.1 pilus assembly protein TadG-related protein [Aurantiacibacter sp. MUD11]
MTRDEQGSLLPMAAVGFLVLAAIVGGGVDLSRAHKAENRLQAACDAGVLAGRRAVGINGFDQAAQDEAEAYFDNNFDPDRQGGSNTQFVASSSDNGNTITATADTDVATTIMAVFGFDEISISVTCSASMGVGNSDVVMVLDSTGSMDDPIGFSGPTKLSMLQDAMKSFYDTVQTSVAGGSARVRYGFVPYSSSINVGHLLNSNYLVDEMTIQSREAVYETVIVEEFDHWDSPVTSTASGESQSWVHDEGVYGGDEYSSRDACSNGLPNDTSWSNIGSVTTDTSTDINGQGQQVVTTTDRQMQTRTAYTCVRRTRGWGRSRTRYYVPYETTYRRFSYDYVYETSDPVMYSVETTEFSHYVYKPVTYDVSSYKGFSSVSTVTGWNGSNVSSTWQGCIEERETTPAASFSFNSLVGITPVSANDLDIDSAPTSDDDTKWRPMWPEVAYYRTSFVATGPGRGRYDLSNNAESLSGGQAYSACPQRAQLLQEMSETAFDAYADSLVARGNTYHDLGMLWGARISSPDGIFASNVNSAPANGGNVARHIIFMTDGQMYPSNAIQSAYGIEFHDRRVTANGVNLLTDRHNSRFEAICEAVKAKGIRLWVIAFATGLTDELEACSSDNSSFTADNADELNSAFQEIANEVGELRIVQ